MKHEEEVRRWFAEVVELPVPQREAYLESKCPIPEVRAEVLSLLAFDAEPGSPNSITGFVQQAMQEIVTAPSQQGAYIGAYQLGRMLGVGGMGRVYEAHRVDGQVRQRVAIKFADLPLGPVERQQAIERFLRERQILASLRHPYIASLIDAGATADGTPYAVIEQVEGVRIDEFCDTRNLDTSARIELAIKLCEAIQFAHRNLVVHRDIKPDNVLVTDDGTPKLIDFGIAKDLAGAGNVTVHQALTPDYASPEQARGFAATAATDVYGLGALLYRLVVGIAPRKITSTSPLELINQIADRDIPAPSKFKPDIPRDLENIILKALHRDQDRRYGSMNDFADDLSRFLDRRPVRATPDSLAYRTSCFIARHWAPLGAAAAVAVGLTAATVIALQQRAEAQTRALEMRQLAGKLIFELHDEITNLKGATRAKEKLAAMSSEYLAKLAPGAVSDPELAWELTNAYYRLGTARSGSYASTGDSGSGFQYARQALALGKVVENSGRSLSPQRVEQLFAVYDQLSGFFHENRLKAEQLDTVNRLRVLAPRLGPYRQAQALLSSARYEDVHGSPHKAAEEQAKAVALLRDALASPNLVRADLAKLRPQLASGLISLGRTSGRIGDFERGAQSLTECIRLQEQLVKEFPDNAPFFRDLYLSYLWLADLQGGADRYNLGRFDDALANYRKAIGLAEKMIADDPNNQMAKLDLARACGKMGSVITDSNPAEALALMDRANALIAQTSLGNKSGLSLRIAYLTNSIDPLVELGRIDQAHAHTDEARRMLERLIKMSPTESGLITTILRGESMWLYKSGKRREALNAATEELNLHLKQSVTGALSDSVEAVDALERIRQYAAGGFDRESCLAAGQKLLNIWQELSVRYPKSEFVKTRTNQARAGASDTAACEVVSVKVR
jgi:tetratricopeptide (TPR) repeat protein